MLRKGGPKPDRTRPGPELEYWRFTSERADLVAAFNAAYPNMPKVVDAYLPFPDMERNWQTWFEEYDAGGLRHRCDGRTMTRWRAIRQLPGGEQPCLYARLQGTQDRTWLQTGRPALSGAPGAYQGWPVGLVTMETHSINDLNGIMTLIDIEQKAGGR